MNTLPQRVREKIQNKNVMKDAPKIEAYQVYEKFLKRKNNVTSVSGDIPLKLKNEFGPELASPAADIFNSLMRLESTQPNGKLSMSLQSQNLPPQTHLMT